MNICNEEEEKHDGTNVSTVCDDRQRTNCRYPEGVKFVVASFENYFGNVTGADLRSWCTRHGWVLAWTHVAIGDPRRLIDPVVSPATKVNASLSAAYVAAFASLWSQAQTAWNSSQTNLDNRTHWKVGGWVGELAGCALSVLFLTFGVFSQFRKPFALLVVVFVLDRCWSMRQQHQALATLCCGPLALPTARTETIASESPTQAANAFATSGVHDIVVCTIAAEL